MKDRERAAAPPAPGRPVHRAAATQDNPANTPLALAGAMGNAAFSRHLAQPRTTSTVAVVSRAAKLSAADRARAVALEARLAAVNAGAIARGTTIADTSDTAIEQLQDAKNHLASVAVNYRLGHKAVTDVLKRADKEYEFDKSVSDAVQGVLVAAVLAVLLPEALVTAAAMATARSLLGSTSSRMTRAGIVIVNVKVATPAVLGAAGNAAAGELAEIGAGKAIDAAGSDSARPTDTIGLAGATTEDKFAEVLGHLVGLVDALPVLGRLSSSQRDVGSAAADLAMSAVKLRAGDPVDTSLPDLENKAAVLEELNAAGAEVLPSIRAMANRMLTLHNLALVVRLEEPVTYENELWNTWMANLLTDSANDILDNDVIEDYLGPKGKKMFDFGRWTSDADEAAAVTAAQRRWLKARGVESTSGGASLILSKFKAHRRLEELRRTVVGRTGHLISSRRIRVNGEVFDYVGNAGGTTGTELRVLHVIIKRHLQGDVNLDRWTNDCYDVYCGPVEVPGATAPAAPEPAMVPAGL